VQVVNRSVLRAFVGATVVATTAAMLIAAAAASPSPGSSAQIAADVAASTSVLTVPSNLSPTIAAAGDDTAYVDTPSLSNCTMPGATLDLSRCVYGDKKGKKTMLLWGDSHAFMWFPPIDAIAKADHWKLVVAIKFGCPVADVSVWNPFTKTPYTSCNSFRKYMIKAINRINPSLVILSEAFTSEAAAGKGASGGITAAMWQVALARSLGELHSRSIKKVILGSTIASAASGDAYPAACVAARPSAVQDCTIGDTTDQVAERTAEASAAKAKHATYVNVLPWLCRTSTRCSPIIGDASTGYFFVYYSTGHVTETYSLWLTTVLAGALKSLL
jgi:hypothetical protein